MYIYIIFIKLTVKRMGLPRFAKRPSESSIGFSRCCKRRRLCNRKMVEREIDNFLPLMKTLFEFLKINWLFSFKYKCFSLIYCRRKLAFGDFWYSVSSYLEGRSETIWKIFFFVHFATLNSFRNSCRNFPKFHCYFHDRPKLLNRGKFASVLSSSMITSGDDMRKWLWAKVFGYVREEEVLS